MELAKYIIAVVAAFNFGGLVADGLVSATARQHLFNPRWPPHAKFHNAQTMLIGILNGMLSLGILFANRHPTPGMLAIAALVAGTYFIAMAFAPLFPGTAWNDPEFAGGPRPLGLEPQQLVSYVLCALIAFALVLTLM